MGSGICLKDTAQTLKPYAFKALENTLEKSLRNKTPRKKRLISRNRKSNGKESKSPGT